VTPFADTSQQKASRSNAELKYNQKEDNKMKLRKILAICMVLAVILSLAACNGGGNNNDNEGSPEANGAPDDNNVPEQGGTEVSPYADLEAVELVFAEAGIETSERFLGMKEVADYVSEKSGGKLSFQLYGNAVMGSNEEILAAVMAGEIAATSTDPGAIISGKLALFDAPRIFSDMDVMDIVCREDSSFLELTEAAMEEANLKMVYLSPANYSVLATTKEVTSIDDIKGMIIRVAGNPMFVQFWEALGASTVTIPLSEVYIALQNGVCNGVVMPFDRINEYKIYEVADYLILTNHVLSKQSVIFNLDVWNSLAPAYQDLILEAMDVAFDGYYIPARDQVNEQYLKDYGQAMTVIELDEAFATALDEAADTVIETLIRPAAGDDYVDACLDAIAAAEQQLYG